MLAGKLTITATAVLILMACTAQAAGNIERGADLNSDCINCHKMDGKGDFETPGIVGLDEAFLLEQLRDFCGAKRDSLDDMMHTYTEDYTDQDLQDLAAYWASREK